MRIFKTVLVVLALSALPLRAADTPNSALSQIVDRIISTEQTEMTSLKPFTPLVETYIQNLRGDNSLGSVPAGDRYFLGRALLAKGVDLETLTDGGETGGGAGSQAGSPATTTPLPEAITGTPSSMSWPFTVASRVTTAC